MSECDCVMQGDTPASVERCNEVYVNDHREKYICTKPEGHDGLHSACNPADHPVEVWG